MDPLSFIAGGPPGLPEPARQLLLRPRLLARLQQRFERRLTTLVAGPGFGKTSLLVQAISENRLSPRGVDAWVSCQPEDSVASTLAQKLLTVLDEGIDPPPSPTATVDLIEASIWRRSPTPTVLVLDDAHLISPGSPGARLLAALVDQLPATGHLLLAGRPPLPLPTARLAALGHMVQLDEQELAFDEEELTEFAALRCVSRDLVQHTGGWPALAELTAAVGEQRAVDFLWEELLSRLPAERRRLLAAVAVVGGGDAEVVAALADGPVNLDSELAGLPLVFGRPGGWRWLHPLWAPALAGQLADGEVEEMRRRAAGVLQRRGWVDPAFRLLTQAHAWDELRSVIRDTAAASHPLVAPDVFAAWHSKLPADLQRGPEGLLLRGLVEKGRDLPAAVQLLERAAERFRQLADVPGETAALVQLGHICWWLQDAERLTVIAERAAALLPAHSNDDVVAAAALAHVLLADITGQPRRVLQLLAAIPADRISTQWSASVEWLRAWAVLALGEPEQARTHAGAALARATGTFRSTSLYIQMLTRWFSGEISVALDAVPELADATALTGRGHNTVFELCSCALLLAYAGREQAAREHLAAAGAALPGARTGAGELVYALAEAAIQVAGGEDERAGRGLLAELAERSLEQPRTAQIHQLFLALSYLLVPSTRAQWEAAELGPRFDTARTLARALAAVRVSGPSRGLTALQLPAPDIVHALLPLPWVAELATALTAVGHPQARDLLTTSGLAARTSVKRLADTAKPAIARAARQLLDDLPYVPAFCLQVDVLGPLRLRRDGEPVTDPDLRRERVRQLLAYLVSYPTTTREAVAANLWPKLDADTAGRNLRVNLTYLQRVLEPRRAEGDPPYFLRTEGTMLRLCGDGRLDVDSWQFDRTLDQADQAERQGVPSRALTAYQQALTLYRGDYLADLPDVEWAELERNRLRLRYQSAAIRAGELLLAGGDSTTPLTLAQAALRVEPWSERAYRLLAAAQLARGDHAAARRALHHCQAMLTDLGAQPDPHTQMLIRRLTPAVAPAPRKSVPTSLP